MVAGGGEMGLTSAAAGGTILASEGEVLLHQVVLAESNGSSNLPSVLQVESEKVLIENILAEIRELREKQAQAIEKLQERCIKIEQQIWEVLKRLQDAEQRISDMEDKIGSLDKVIVVEQKKN
ncbi:hypothetical protein NDU88_002142 [Pleurodeles waltl]|uniref:Uncharacterized protein n=1 Tax=Pleurodeles waltl TaxID=8319 RepID=A0AAV7M1B3_PLEWA|nr:hypothetical protein NDU88_002142 [Pleurodeles waltl]